MAVTRNLFNAAVSLCQWVGIAPPTEPANFGTNAATKFIADALAALVARTNPASPALVAHSFAYGGNVTGNTGGVLPGSYNIASIVHTYTGNYLVTFTRPLTNHVFPVACGQGGPGSSVMSTQTVDANTIMVYSINNDGFTFQDSLWFLTVQGY